MPQSMQGTQLCCLPQLMLGLNSRPVKMWKCENVYLQRSSTPPPTCFQSSERISFKRHRYIFELLIVTPLTRQVPAVCAAPAEDWPLHVELGGGAAPHALQVCLHHGVGVREILVLGDGGQVLSEINIDFTVTKIFTIQRNIIVSWSWVYSMLHDCQ